MRAGRSRKESLWNDSWGKEGRGYLSLRMLVPELRDDRNGVQSCILRECVWNHLNHKKKKGHGPQHKSSRDTCPPSGDTV